MCGIAGYVTAIPDSSPPSVLERMTDCISHRGPDGFGYYRDAHAQLGHRRLSIVDLAGGAQPMFNEDGSLAITYNGEVFNHAGLRDLLEQAGHRYRSRCDTETIVHAYEEYGPESLARLRGMFSFAIWDRNTKTLFCARDRLGIKPFYYFWDGRLFAFASEIKALLEYPGISAALDETTLPEYLAFGYLSDERTMFAHIRQLLPGHWLRVQVEDGRLRVETHPYWDAPQGPFSPSVPDDEGLIQECRRRTEETVRMRLMSDVPLGMFLSGGVDSSVIAALMKRMVTGPVETFSVGYRESAFSELEYARQVARHLGTDHHEVVLGERDFFNALPRLVWHEDEPITWPSSVSLYFVSRLAASRVKVVLTGEGSDELFGGYSRYRHYLQSLAFLRAYRWVPEWGRASIRNWIASSSLLSASLRRKLHHTALGREPDITALYLDNFYSAFSAHQQTALRGRPPETDDAYEAAAYENYLCYRDRASQASELQRLLYADQKTYLVELLRKQDRMSMACSIESRVPFLDHPLVEFSGGVPDHLKIRGRLTKYVLKRAVEDLLPPVIIHRKKMGFPTPLAQWLLGESGQSVAALLRDPNGLLAGCVDRGALNQLLESHQNGVEDATDRIWRLLNLQLWGDMFLTGRRELRWEGFLSVPARQTITRQ